MVEYKPEEEEKEEVRQKEDQDVGDGGQVDEDDGSEPIVFCPLQSLVPVAVVA